MDADPQKLQICKTSVLICQVASFTRVETRVGKIDLFEFFGVSPKNDQKAQECWRSCLIYPMARFTRVGSFLSNLFVCLVLGEQGVGWPVESPPKHKRCNR